MDINQHILLQHVTHNLVKNRRLIVLFLQIQFIKIKKIKNIGSKFY